MRTSSRWRRTAIAALAIGLLGAACAGTDSGSEPNTTPGGETPTAPPADEPTGEATSPADDGPAGDTIVVGSFNFSESVILAEIYAQALEANDFPVERNLNLGARELVFPELESGSIGLMPEYVGSALSVGFGGEPTGDLESTLSDLRSEFEAIGVTVLEPAPGEDKNAFVVTGDFAEANGLTTISDLTGIDNIRFAGPPECEDRDTCLQGLIDVYGLDNIEFEAIPDGSVRIASLENGEIDLTLLFSTQPVITEKGFVALEDDQGIVPVENIVPVVNSSLVEAHGADLTTLLDGISELITTEVLLDLNGRVELEAEDPADVAAEFLADNGLS